MNNYCACRGTMGIAHVSCLAQQAQSAMDDEFSKEDLNARGSRWHTCRLCGQKIHGEVRCALGWANWRTCVKAAAAGERPPAELATRQLFAVQQLGNGMQDLKGNEEEALKMHEIYLDTLKRDFSHNREMLFIALGNLSNSYCGLGRHEECLALEMECYRGMKDMLGPSHDRHVREDRNSRRSSRLVAGLHPHVGENCPYDHIAAPLLREVLQARGHLGDVGSWWRKSRYDPPCFYKWTLSQVTLSRRRRLENSRLAYSCTSLQGSVRQRQNDCLRRSLSALLALG